MIAGFRQDQTADELRECALSEAAAGPIREVFFVDPADWGNSVLRNLASYLKSRRRARHCAARQEGNSSLFEGRFQCLQIVGDGRTLASLEVGHSGGTHATFPAQLLLSQAQKTTRRPPFAVA